MPGKVRKVDHDGAAAMFFCPISQELVMEPVMGPEGQVYERDAIEAWLGEHGSSPTVPTMKYTKERLVACPQMVQVVEGLVEAGAVSDEEAAAWRARRKQVATTRARQLLAEGKVSEAAALGLPQAQLQMWEASQERKSGQDQAGGGGGEEGREDREATAALEWLKKGAAQGFGPAQLALGKHYIDEYDLENTNLARGERVTALMHACVWLQRATAESADSMSDPLRREAKRELGACMASCSRVDVCNVVPNAAQRGFGLVAQGTRLKDAETCCVIFMARMLRDGVGTRRRDGVGTWLKPDCVAARGVFEAAFAADGDDIAQSVHADLAPFYLGGKGGATRDFSRGYALLKAGRDLGDARASRLCAHVEEKLAMLADGLFADEEWYRDDPAQPGDWYSVPRPPSHSAQQSTAWSGYPSEAEAAGLRGVKLADALQQAGLPRGGTKAQKTQRLVEHVRVRAAVSTAARDACVAGHRAALIADWSNRESIEEEVNGYISSAKARAS